LKKRNREKKKKKKKKPRLFLSGSEATQAAYRHEIGSAAVPADMKPAMEAMAT
jgi:hypothetical protein